MTGYLLDTDILINVGRGYTPAVAFLSSLEGKQVYTSTLTEAELLVGVNSKKHLKWMEDFLARFQRIPIDVRVDEHALDILRRHYLASSIGIVDAHIAATALEYEMVLHTKNVKHYRRIEGLDLQTPYR